MIRKQNPMFGQLVHSLAVARIGHSKGAAVDAGNVAERRGWPLVAQNFKAAQPATVGASGLVVADGIASQVIGDIPRDRLAGHLAAYARPMAGFHQRMVVTDAEALIAEEVAEAEAIPCVGLSASQILVSPRKVSIAIPYSEEVVVDPRNADLIQNDTELALWRGLDAAIVTTLTPGSAGGIAATSKPADDMRKVFAPLDLTGVISPVVVAAVDTALLMSTLRDAGGAVFGEMTPSGGHAYGAPVFVNDRVTAGALLALNPEAIGFRIDTVEVAVSREASLEQNTAPAQGADTGTGATMVSMFQNYAIALRLSVSFALVALRGEHVSEELTSIAWTNA